MKSVGYENKNKKIIEFIKSFFGISATLLVVFIFWMFSGGILIKNEDGAYERVNIFGKILDWLADIPNLISVVLCTIAIIAFGIWILYLICKFFIKLIKKNNFTNIFYFFSKDARTFRKQLYTFKKADISLCNLKKDFVTQKHCYYIHPYINVPRQLFPSLNNLDLKLLLSIYRAHYSASNIEEFEHFADIIYCKNCRTEEEPIEKYKNATRIIMFIINQYMIKTINSKAYLPIMALFQKLTDLKYIKLKDQIIHSDPRFMCDICNDDFTVRISPCYGLDDENNVYMRHGEQYSIILLNDSQSPANVKITIDDKCVGIFRLKNSSSTKIERPINDSGHFTFYKYGTSEGLYSEIKRNMGYISCKFYKEKTKYNISLPDCNFSLSDNFSEGGTGLSEESSQNFAPYEEIETEDSFTEIKFRLVGIKEKPKKIHSIKSLKVY